MFSLKLENITLNSKTNKHEVCVGSGAYQEFTNKKDAAAYLVSISKRLTKNLQTAHIIFSDAVVIINSYIFDISAIDFKRYIDTKYAVEERIYFLLHRYHGKSNLVIINTLLYIFLQVKEIVIWGLSSIKKAKYTGHEIKLENCLEQIDRLINDLRIKSKIVYTDTESFKKDYSTKYIKNVA